MRFIFVYTPFYTNADWILLMRRMKIMKILDFYWSSNTDWWEWKPNGMRVIKPDAPKEAQESYKHYLEQISWRTGKIIININIYLKINYYQFFEF